MKNIKNDIFTKIPKSQKRSQNLKILKIQIVMQGGLKSEKFRKQAVIKIEKYKEWHLQQFQKLKITSKTPQNQKIKKIKM